MAGTGTNRSWVGNNDFAGWIKNLEGEEINGAEDLHDLCEQARSALQYVSAVMDVVAAEVRGKFRDADRFTDPADEAIEFTPHYARRFRGTVRELSKVSDALEAGAKHSATAWLKFEKAAIELDADRKEAQAKHLAKNKAPGAKAPGKGFDFHAH